LPKDEPGIRNRARQKEERQLKAKMDIEKHQRSFHKIADTTPTGMPPVTRLSKPWE
jgi:hypothetical protein